MVEIEHNTKKISSCKSQSDLVSDMGLVNVRAHGQPRIYMPGIRGNFVLLYSGFAFLRNRGNDTELGFANNLAKDGYRLVHRGLI